MPRLGFPSLRKAHRLTANAGAHRMGAETATVCTRAGWSHPDESVSGTCIHEAPGQQMRQPENERELAPVLGDV